MAWTPNSDLVIQTVRIEREQRARIHRDILAAGAGESLSIWIRRAIANELARREEQRRD